MLQFYSGVSDAVNPKKAIRESIESALGSNLDQATLLIVHSTMGHNLNQLLKSAQALCPHAQIVGCTGSGVIGQKWVSEKMRAVAVMAIIGEEFAVASKSGLNGQNSEEITAACAKELKAKRSDINMVMTFGPGTDVNGDGMVAGIESVFGPEVPIFGALAGFSGKDPRTPMFHNDQILEGAVVMIGFADQDLVLVQGAHHGSLPQEDYSFTITKAEGNRVDELDGKPAWPTMLDSLGLPHSTAPGDIIAMVGLGIEIDDSFHEEYDNKHILHAPLHLSEDGLSFFFQADVEEGTKIVSCQRNEEHIFSGVERLTARINNKLETVLPVAVFQADCMARGRMAHNVVEKNEIIANIQSPVIGDQAVPWLGVYGFAEFAMINGKNLFHNYTTALSIVARKSKTPEVSGLFQGSPNA